MKLLTSVPSLFLVAAILLAASPSASVAADEVEPNATIVVNSNADVIANDGSCTLREAITAANSNTSSGGAAGECIAGSASGTDTITFAGNYVITLTLGSQLPEITSPIIINGNGAANTIIQASDCNPVTEACTHDYRVFEVGTEGDLTLESLTVRHGRCAGGCPIYTHGGGGVLNRGAMTLTNVTLSANSAYSGAGMFNYNSSPTLTGVIFSDNSANFGGHGGGMYNENNSNPTLTDVTFIGNSAARGGGMDNFNSNPTLTDVIFSVNSVSEGGGGIYNGNSNPTLTNVTFSGNTASSYGGGMANGISSPTLTNVTFSTNSATIFGGGMDNYYNSNPTLTNVTFSDNTAGNSGGGMKNDDSSPTLTNVTLSNNTANWGGGMHNYLNSNPTLTNVTFSDNAAGNSGGGMFNEDNSSPTLINVIIADSPNGGDCVNDSTLNPASRNSLIEDGDNACGLTHGVNGNIIGFDPSLVPLGDNGGFTQTFALQGNSPALNAGSNTGCPATDQRGLARPQGPKCDIGAFEYPHVNTTFRSSAKLDGWVLESDEFSNKGGTLNRGAKTFNLGDDETNKQYRAILSFNTSSIPTDANITKVTLRLKRQGVTGGGNPVNFFGGFKVDIKNGNFGKASLQLSDFNFKTGVKTLSKAYKPKLSKGWYTINLGSAGGKVNTSGNTQIRLRFKLDDNNNNVANILKLYSGNAGAANRPQLIVEYYVP